MSSDSIQNAMFLAKTSSAFTIKTLGEVLQNILTDVCFEFSSQGIKLITMDNKEPSQLMIHLNLHHNRFEKYHCDDVYNIGINLQHFHKLLKSIKKKDEITLFIDPKHPDILKICTETDKQKSLDNIKIQKLEKLDIETVQGYDKHPHIIFTSGFQKLCKNITGINSKEVKVYTKGNYICFSAEFEGFYKREIPFGEYDEWSEEEEYQDVFYSKSISQLTKITGLHQKMSIYTKTDLPLKFSVDVGDLGRLDIFIKSKTQLE